MGRVMRVLGIGAVAAALLGAAVPTGARPADVQVRIAHWRFHPKILQITAGTTVVWLNEQKGNHTSISDAGLWKSGPIPPGGTFSFTFTTPGTYPYHCKYGHGIHGEVDVLPAAGR